MTIKCTNIFHCKTLQNLPKLGFWFQNMPSSIPSRSKQQSLLSKNELGSMWRLKKYFCKKNWQKCSSFLAQTRASFCKSLIITLGKSAKIAENSDHNNDPCLGRMFCCIEMCPLCSYVHCPRTSCFPRTWVWRWRPVYLNYVIFSVTR
jgi:hypothetical protein